MATDEQKAAAYDLLTGGVDIPQEQKAERWDRKAVKYRNVRDSFGTFTKLWPDHWSMEGAQDANA